LGAVEIVVVVVVVVVEVVDVMGFRPRQDGFGQDVVEMNDVAGV